MNDGSAARGFSLKDQLFNAEKVRYLGGLFGFEGFEAAVMTRLLEFELKERINWIADVLADFLPDDFPRAAQQITTALPPPLDPTLTDDDFGDFIFAPLSEYVVRHGMEDHRDVSLDLLRDLTKRFSVEYAIRHFLNRWPDETMAALSDWSRDENYHVRRLVSEGTRPTLPWGVKIGLDIRDPLPLLDQLHADPTRFVTRSVANHLNDITKKDPTLVLETLQRWQNAGSQNAKELDWMTRHALRTLVKKGDPHAMEMLGYHTNPAIQVGGFSGPDAVNIGEVAAFEFTVTAERDERLMLDYVIDFVKSNGSTAPKVFKIKQLHLKAGDSVTIQKNHRFVKGATTFTHYPGMHCMTLQINGKAFSSHSFTLK